jgi:4'-phosphopantetheinyl transferase
VTVPDLAGRLLPISTTAVRVRWLVLDAVAPEMWVQFAALLDDAERARALRFHFDRDRQAYIAAHALARTLLSVEAVRPPAAWRFVEGPHGKPEVVREPGVPPLRFNLSHTHGLVAVALTLAHDIGIDVEIIDSKRAGLDFAQRVFAPAEAELLRVATQEALPETFFAIWTLKEACIKALGGGLSVPLDSFSLVLDPLSVHFTDALGEDAEHWRLWRTAPTPTHALAMALRHPDPTVVAIDAAGVGAQDILDLAAHAAFDAGQMDRR